MVRTRRLRTSSTPYWKLFPLHSSPASFPTHVAFPGGTVTSPCQGLLVAYQPHRAWDLLDRHLVIPRFCFALRKHGTLLLRFVQVNMCFTTHPIESQLCLTKLFSCLTKRLDGIALHLVKLEYSCVYSRNLKLALWNHHFDKLLLVMERIMENGLLGSCWMCCRPTWLVCDWNILCSDGLWYSFVGSLF